MPAGRFFRCGTTLKSLGGAVGVEVVLSDALDKAFAVELERRKARTVFQCSFVHVEGAVEFELDGVDTVMGASVLACDRTAFVGVVGGDTVAVVCPPIDDEFREERGAASTV